MVTDRYRSFSTVFSCRCCSSGRGEVGRHAAADSAREPASGATFDAPVALCAHLGYLWTLRWLPPVHLSIAVARKLVFGPL